MLTQVSLTNQPNLRSGAKLFIISILRIGNLRSRFPDTTPAAERRSVMTFPNNRALQRPSWNVAGFKKRCHPGERNDVAISIRFPLSLLVPNSQPVRGEKVPHLLGLPHSSSRLARNDKTLRSSDFHANPFTSVASTSARRQAAAERCLSFPDGVIAVGALAQPGPSRLQPAPRLAGEGKGSSSLPRAVSTSPQSRA